MRNYHRPAHALTDGASPIARTVDLFFRLIEVTLVFSLLLMVGLVFGNVVLRYALNTGIASSEELARLLFVWMVFLGAALMLRENAHLGIDTLVRRLPRSGRLGCFLLSNALVLYGTWLLLDGSWRQTVINWPTTTPVLGISQAWFYIAVLVFAVIGGGIVSVRILQAVTGRLSNEDLIGVKESEEEFDLPQVPARPEAAEPSHRGDRG